MELRRLILGIETKKVNASLEMDIKGISYDSRKVQPGDLFVCIKGEKLDGHNYIDEALGKGASLIMTERELEENVPFIEVKDGRRALAKLACNFYENPSKELCLIGVTGTNGKTTTTYLIKSILEESGAKVGLIGTNQNMIANEALKAERTTPEALELQMLLSHMKEQGVTHVVMEVSSHALSLSRVDGCTFAVAIFTNLTQDHLDFHGNMEDYFKAKAKLFEMTTAGILNIDDEYGERILAGSSAENFTYAIKSESADVVAKDINLLDTGVAFKIISVFGISRFNLGIPGKFSVYNALAAITCAMVLNIDMEHVENGLSKMSSVKGRMEVLKTGTPYTVMIDYAHTPDALLNVLQSLREGTKGKIICVFGCGGDRDNKKRPLMGAVAAKYSDIAVVTSDNPRSEEPSKIIEEIVAGMKCPKTQKMIVQNRREGIKTALSIAKEGDVVVLCGKGHETYQLLKNETIHFDEREVVAEILGEAAGG